MKNTNYYFYSLIILVWVVIIVVTGTLFSGYHFVDDHMFITITNKLRVDSFISVLKQELQDDFKIRFRPLYVIFKLAEIKFLGPNLVLHSVFLFILAAFTNCILFISGIRFGLTKFQSFLTSLLILVGYQSSIWWMLGPAETFGVLLLSLSTLMLAHYVNTNANRYKSLYILFFILAAFVKESFLLLAPALSIVMLYVDYTKRKCSLWEAVIFNKTQLALITIVFLGCVFIIVLSVGLNGIGYAGLDSSTGLQKYFASIKLLLFDKTFWLIVLGLLILLFIENFNKESAIRIMIILSFFILLILPQYILYAKSGFTFRYLLPAYFIMGLFIGIIFYLINPFHTWLSTVFTLLVVIFLTARMFLNAYPIAKEFAEEGRGIGKIFSEIKSDTKTGDTLLIVSDLGIDYETGYALREYIKFYLGHEIKFFPIQTENESQFNESLREKFLRDNPRSIAKDLSSYAFKIISPSVFKSNVLEKNSELSSECVSIKNIMNFIIVKDTCR